MKSVITVVFTVEGKDEWHAERYIRNFLDKIYDKHMMFDTDFDIVDTDTLNEQD